MIDQVLRFVQEAYHELKLSSWLSRKEMVGSTIIVLILTLLVAGYVAIIDRILLFFASRLFNIG